LFDFWRHAKLQEMKRLVIIATILLLLWGAWHLAWKWKTHIAAPTGVTAVVVEE